MYKPQDDDRPQYPVFAKVNGRIIPFLSLKGFLAIAAVLVVGVGLFFAAAAVTHEVDVDVPPAEQSAEHDAIKAQRSAVQYDAARRSLEPYVDGEGAVRADLGVEERIEYQELSSKASSLEVVLSMYSPSQRADLAERAAERGITAETSDEELEGMVATTRRATVPVMDDFMRFLVFIFIPVGAAISAVFEVDGMSLVSAIGDRVSYRRKQHVFFYRRAH